MITTSIFLSKSIFNSSNPSRTITLQALLKRGFGPTNKALNLFLLFLLRSRKHQLVLHVYSQFSSSIFVNTDDPRTDFIVAHALLRCHRFEEAERIIARPEKIYVLTRKGLWDSLIRGVCLVRENPEKGLSLMQECVRNHGMQLSPLTLRVLVLKFCSLGNLEGAIKVVELMIEGRSESPLDSSFFSKIVGQGVDGFCKHGTVKKAIEFLSELEKRGLKLTLVNCIAIMRGLRNVECTEDKEEGVLKVLDLTGKLEPHVQCSMYNHSVVFLCKEGCFDAALHLCLLMKQKGLIVGNKSYYVVTKRLILTGMGKLVRLMLNPYLKEYGISGHRMLDIVSLYLCKKNETKALPFLCNMGVKNMSSSITTAVVDSLKKDGRVQEAHKFVVEAEDCGVEADSVVYSIVVDGLCKEGHLEKALELCEGMKEKGAHPNIFTYNSIINGLRQQGCLVEAFRLFNSLEQNYVVPTIVTYGTLIDALSREGLLEDAKKLLEQMICKNVTPNIHVYNSLIYGYCSFGLIMDSLKFLHELELNCLQPDSFTVSSLLGGFYVKSDMEGALGFYTEYKKKGVSPDFLGFTCLIKGLCSKGRIEEARSILRDMLQCEPVTFIINRAGDGICVESLASILNKLCEEGSIKDAINLLDEIGYFSFPSKRYSKVSGHSNLNEFPEMESTVTINETLISASSSTAMKPDTSESMASKHAIEDANIELCDAVKQHDVSQNLGNMKKVPSHDFETYYSMVASLCSKGELQKAKSVVMEMLISYR